MDKTRENRESDGASNTEAFILKGCMGYIFSKVSKYRQFIHFYVFIVLL